MSETVIMDDNIYDELSKCRRDLYDNLSEWNNKYITIDGKEQLYANGESLSTFSLVKRELKMRDQLNDIYSVLLHFQHNIDNNKNNK